MDCNLLIIAAPTMPLSEPELQKIEKYLAEGGRLFALFNYASINRSTGLEPIFQRWGVNVAYDYVKDSDNTYTGQDIRVRYNSAGSAIVNPLTQLSLQMILPRPVGKIQNENPAATRRK